ncbi:MAG TPA: dienelactone hydrolase family protein [Gemmatimonadaceae bacterium]|nr:dienelactone hydrolase family protein [Gemmatimonadaceae bacterium]
MTDEYITLHVSDAADMRAFVARPRARGNGAGLLLFQEALGVNAQLRRVAERWAGEGYVVAAPELFHRVAPGYERSKLDMAELMPMIKTLTVDGMVADARAAFDWMTKEKGVDAKRIAALGFCMGGRAAYLANSELPLAAAVSYYGGSIAPNLLDRAAKLHGPHLFFWGGIDQGIPPEQRRAVADAVRAAGKKFVDVEFSDANHGFFNEELPERHNASAAAQSWALATAFLRQHC